MTLNYLLIHSLLLGMKLQLLPSVAIVPFELSDLHFEKTICASENIGIQS